ncbi:hypothetical protein GQ473_00955 [archaeon]|nr:hypothetical protein [archaeon]
MTKQDIKTVKYILESINNYHEEVMLIQSDKLCQIDFEISVDELSLYDIQYYDVKKYFITLKNAIKISSEFYFNPNMDLQFIESNIKLNAEKYHDYYAEHSDYYINYYKQYLKDNPEKASMYARNQAAKRKGWGNPQPINEPFEGAHLHHLHINNDHRIAIFIPAELHESARHAYNRPETMEVINQLAFEWLATCDVI